MSPTPDEFRLWVEERERQGDLLHYELLNGAIVATPVPVWPHGAIVANVVYAIASIANSTSGAVALGSSQGFVLPAGDVVQPDASFVSRERWDAAEAPVYGEFLRVVPDLVIEVALPSTISRDQGEKLLIYSRAGVREYWIVDHRLRRVSQWTRGETGLEGPVVHDQEGASIASTAVPGLSMALASIFR